MIGAVEEYVLQNTKKRMNAGELKAERIEEHDMLNWVKANLKVLKVGIKLIRELYGKGAITTITTDSRFFRQELRLRESFMHMANLLTCGNLN